MERILVTGNENPDLDAVACSYAYAELLNSAGIAAVAGIFGKPHKEAEFALVKSRVRKIKDAGKLIGKCKKIILVDASILSGLSKEINPMDVVEIIDHRKVHEASAFPNATAQIELVGAAATLIAEKFHARKIDISKKSALLLYSAIISNTINLQANVTTKRDKKMAGWLKSKLSIGKDYVHEMFSYKSNITGNLKREFMKDISFQISSPLRMGIIQMEMIDVGGFLAKNMEKIRKVLPEIMEENDLDSAFVTFVDIEKGFNLFVAIDERTRKIVENSLDVRFEGEVAERNGILMRKEIIPKIKEALA